MDRQFKNETGTGTLIVIKENALITGLDESEVNNIKHTLTIDNPLYEKLRQLEKPVWGIPTQLTYYTVIDDSSIEIPVGALALKSVHTAFDIKSHKINDLRKNNKRKIKINFKGTLRDYQTPAIDTLKTKTVGVLQAGTGSGKTVIAINHVCKHKRKTLILVNTIELLNQFIARLVQFTSLKEDDIGRIGSGKYIVKPVTVALLQSMRNLTTTQYKELNSKFSQIITDEVHIISAETYYTVITKLAAKYKFGLSATPKRPDGLTRAIFFATGPIVHAITDEDVGENILLPELEEVVTEYNFPLFDSSEYQTMMDDIAKNKKRNTLIISKHKGHHSKQSVFLCNRIAHAMELKKKIPHSEVLSSKVPKKKRAEIMKKLDENKLKAVITTYSLFSTGIDLANLERLYMCGPIRSEIKIIQSAGRIRRKGKKGKRPIIIDFVDKEVGLLRNQWYARRRIWKQLKILK